MADIEESDPANQDKIILYHGETYGTWIYQMIIKAFQFPDAPEDWLPLRFEPLNDQIDKTTLLRLIKPLHFDHQPEYTRIGMSVTPNLYSESVSESAWGSICKKMTFSWDKITGYSDNGHMHDKLYDLLKEKFIPKAQWNKFSMQKKLLSYFIQTKREQYPTYYFVYLREKFESHFPRTLSRYRRELEPFFNFQQDVKPPEKFYTEGVALQIIMEKELADEITYNSHPFGWLKDDDKYSEFEAFVVEKKWENDEFMPYSEVYEKVKNYKDNEQARLALTNDFRKYPSRVRIKSIAGIMDNPVDYEIVRSMIQEMTQIKKSNFNGMQVAREDENMKLKTKGKKKKTRFGKIKKLFGFF